MPFGNSVESTCKECGESFHHLKKLSEHLKKIHQLSSIDYVIKYEHGGIRPTCLHCGGETRFVSLGDGFKKYCVADRKIAESAAGKVGGKIKNTWNKGQTKDTDVRLLEFSKNSIGEKNHFYGKKHSVKTTTEIADKKRLSFDVVVKRIMLCSSNTEVVSDESDYITQNSLLKIRCTLCGTDDIESSFNIQRCWRCKKCYPIASKTQLEIADYVKSILGDEKVIISTRDIISPLELDIWIPSKNVAIEYHGLYWHSGGHEGVFDKKRHRMKYLQCKERGIKLIQIFSDEWIARSNVVKSIISHALGESILKLNARDCSIITITSRESKPFLNDNHVNGATRASSHYALTHPEFGIVGVATVRKPIQKKWGEGIIELARMAFKQGVVIRGGASKLIKRIVIDGKATSATGLLSYAELRYGEGSVYEKCGLIRVDDSKVNYWYTDGYVRFDRFKYRAQPGKSEAQVAMEANVRPVYGCGNATYLMKF